MRAAALRLHAPSRDRRPQPPGLLRHWTGSVLVTNEDNRSLTGILITTLCLLVASLFLYFKRKILVRVFFINKKTTIKKLRSVGATRPSSSFESNYVSNSTHCKNLVKQPQSLTTPKRNNTQRLLQARGDISYFVKAEDIPKRSPPERIQPSLCELSSQQSVSGKLLLTKSPLKFGQESCKPRPPEKPLPADPRKSKAAQFNVASKTKYELPIPVCQMVPIRYESKHPVHMPKSCNAACMQ